MMKLSYLASIKKGEQNESNNLFSTCGRLYRKTFQRSFFGSKKQGEQNQCYDHRLGYVGILWKKPVLTIAVRPSRYTFSLIENADDFTLTLPFPLSNMEEKIRLSGSKSGRNCDKFKECGLTTMAAQKVGSPIIKTKGRFYECTIIQATKIDEKRLSTHIAQEHYRDKAYHTLYCGEIVSAYEIQDL